ncbi:hypothetical protein FSZ31_02040 [Sphingorhabdus soli]|uniref:Uncharacterized protein n=1 Tax=Flavisphingopyxis soli TaxID=2601267 RepID=A0A5C6UN35_9SPHN|nr:hypothetical protein [Sphingorhabdus soli]TXC73551.1 hypothetical protein FSZ31_02040 [Sphingorhabdus soli]
MKAFLIAAVAVTLANPAWAVEQAAPVQTQADAAQAQQDSGVQGDAQAGDDDLASASANPNAAGDTKDPNRKICRKQEVLGTRLHQKRVCATAAEWARMRAEHQQSTEQVQNGKFTFDGE